ncbi:MAG TPA: hypothetical protein V6D17_21190 [Candidatus Obscuribacterales bacterium]
MPKNLYPLALAIALSASTLAPQLPPGAAQPPTEEKQEVDSAPQPPTPVYPALMTAIQEYNHEPNAATWDRVILHLRELLVNPQFSRLDAGSIVKANAGLSELGLKVIDAGGARVWTFPNVTYAQAVLVSWQQITATTATRPGRRRPVKVVVTSSSPRVQSLTIPASVMLNDARIVHRVVFEPAPPGKPRKVKSDGGRNLIFAGNDRTSGLIWLKALKLAEGKWYDSAEVLSGIPPFLLQNVQGRASFAGSDLILNIAAQRTGGDETAKKPQRSQAGSYKIVLKLQNGRYVLEGKSPDEGPIAIVHQFLAAVRQGRHDLAKAWLVDGKLAAIPGYLNLYGKTDKQYRVIAMANPASGGSRFRVITFGKNDLILDVGTIKKMEAGKPRFFNAIKGVFVAPPDPFAQRLLGVSSLSDRPREQEASESANSSQAVSQEKSSQIGSNR